ncbi:hypothetical protein [Corynebacterium aurimucosum]|uniref:Putative membrane protein n=1 Tax=Corynebacterium aurimucosum (strain ATCC 700975 / DSM 44827 / CIP 107346 / CN-1) TaxID=548476 RepID=C3PGW2_CORA7|nr:hypothetical protein [Corynebacterium aurimucosum]ACP33066.1 putative membrane protein [Corynebacterium aurimucosum ATCC 700975]QQU92799.1 hypothetical protein I6I67_11335 [Corynebacterium aurimucosum]
MTNPFESNPEDNGSNRGFGSNPAHNSGDSSGNNGGLPKYEPTSHPEDQAGFGQSSSYGNYGGGAYGSQSYGGYEAGQPGYAGAGYGSDSSYEGPGPGAGPAYTGPVSAIEAIKWGFKAALSNALLWVLGAVVVFAIQFVPQIGISVGAQNADGAETSVMVDLFSFAVSILSFVIALVVYRLAYREIDKPSPTWGTLFQGVRWVPPLVVNIVLGILGAIVLVIVIVGLFMVGLGGVAGVDLQNPEQLSENDIFALVGSIFGGVIIVMLIALFIQPFFTLMPWLAADSSSVGEAFSQGLKLGKENYGHILLFIVLSGLMAFASLITLGLALIIIAPALQLATAHLCRQCQGRYAPAA